MRYLFSALLLLNIVFFVWQYQKENHEPLAAPRELIQDNSVATLTLQSEVKHISANGSPHSAEVGLGQGLEQLQHEPDSLCYTVGPFSDSQSADQALSIFREAGIAGVKREVEDKEIAGYWVHLPEENDLTTTRQMLLGLKSKKISDVSIVPLDDGLYVVSLGVFSKKTASESRHAQFAAMGYSPVVVERFKINMTVWIDVMAIGPSLLTAELWQELADKFPATSHAEITCQ